MADGTITFKTDLDNAALQKKLTKTLANIERLEQRIAGWQSAKIPLVEQSAQIAANLDAAKAKLAGMQANQPQFSNDAIAEQKVLVAGLQSEYNKIENAIDRINAKISSGTAQVGQMKDDAGCMQQELADSAEEGSTLGTELHIAGKKMDQFLDRVKKLAVRVLVFNLIARGLRALIAWMGKAIATNDEARAAIARLKGALLTLAQPILDFVIPALTLLVNVLTRVITLVMKLFDALFGSSFLAGSRKSAKALNDKMNAIGGVGSAAKEASRYLAGFDEINAMNDNSDGGGGGGSSGIGADFDFDTNTVTSKLDEIAVYAAGALLALGVILTFTGANIPLGLGLIAIGALVLASEAKENWGAMGNGVTEAINIVLGILAGAGLVIGAILAFTGANIPLGIGLMIMGAAALGAEIALNWDAIKTELQGPMGKLVAMISAAVLVLGAILTFTGAALPLGIALMVIGAAGLATTAALNWDKIKDELTGANAKTYALLAGALLVIGAILAFSGIGLGVGIALMVVGAAGLATIAVLNWDSIVSALRGPMGKTVALISGALLVIGIILCFTGVALPLGIALIAAGAAGLVTVTALNWNAITEKVKTVWDNIKSWWARSVAPKFTIAFWKEKFSAISKGLTSKIKDGINAAISLFNRFIGWINDKLHIRWDSVKILGKEIIPSGDFQLLRLPQIPMLAQGAVIPPNREFMAVLGDQKHGTNIEAPLETIQEAVALVLDDQISAMMAGFEALLEENRQLRATVEGIEVGDTTIGRAANRYNQRLAVQRGG